ncbi:MAG: HAD-IA family hydrolase [Pseudomonadota bacterium]
MSDAANPYLVIFDCDGTLVDSQNIIVTAMTRAFQSAGRTPPTRGETLSIVGLSLPVAMSMLAPDADDNGVERLVEDYRKAFGALRSEPSLHEPMFDGMADALRALHARPDVVIGMATGKSRRGVDRIVEKHDLGGMFSTIQTADGHPSKPHPSMIEQAMRDADAEPQRTVMIGDTTFDVEMAVAAGVTPIGVAWGYHDVAELRSGGADLVAETPAELISMIDRAFDLEGAS